MMAIQKNRDSRYQTSVALAEDLQRHLRNEPVIARKPGVLYRVKKFSRRNKTLFTVLSIVGVTILAGVIGTAWQAMIATKRLHSSEILRLASTSRAVQTSKPQLSILLALEAARRSTRQSGNLSPVAHEALLNATHGITGTPLPLSTSWRSKIVVMDRQVAVLESGQVHLLDMEQAPAGESRRILVENATALAASGDKQWLLTASDRVQKWDTGDMTRTGEGLALAFDIEILAANHDGSRFVAQCDDGCVRVGDFESNSWSILGPPDKERQPRRIAITPNGKWAAISTHSSISLWDVRQDPQQVRLEDVGGGLDFVFSPDSRYLVVRSGREKEVTLFDLEASDLAIPRNRFEHDFASHGMGIAISPDARWLFTTEDWGPRIFRWDLQAENPTASCHVMLAHRDRVEPMVLSDDGRFLCSGSRDGCVCIWDLTSSEEPTPKVLKSHDTFVLSVAIHPKGDWIASVSNDGSTRLWNRQQTSSSGLAIQFPAADDAVSSSLAISPSGRWIVTTDRYNWVILRDMTRPIGDSLRLWQADGLVLNLHITANNRWLAAKTSDGVRVWDLEAADVGATVRHARTKQGSVQPGLTSSPDSEWLLASDCKGDCLIWGLGSKLEEPDHVFPHNVVPSALNTSPDCRWLITATRDEPLETNSTIRVWDLTKPTDSSPKVAISVASLVPSCAIDNNDQWIAAVQNSGILLCNLLDHKVKRKILLDRDPQAAGLGTGVFQVAISPNGHWLFCRRAMITELTFGTFVIMSLNGSNCSAIGVYRM